MLDQVMKIVEQILNSIIRDSADTVAARSKLNLKGEQLMQFSYSTKRMKNISQGNVISTSHFIVFYLQTVYQQSVHKLGMDEWVTRVVVLEYKGVNTECS